MSDLLRYAWKAALPDVFLRHLLAILEERDLFSLTDVTCLGARPLVPDSGLASRRPSGPSLFPPCRRVSSRRRRILPFFRLGDLLLALYAAGALLFFARLVFHLSSWELSSGKEAAAPSGCKVVSVDREFAPFSFLNFVFLNVGAVSPDD